MNNNKINEILFELISSQSFDKLTAEEKKLVLSQITEEEYRAMAELKVNVTNTFKQQEPLDDVNLKEKLMASYESRHKKASLLNRTIPLYQAAAAVIFVGLLMAGWHYYSMSFRSKDSVVTYQNKRDTIYVPSASNVKDGMQSPEHSNSGRSIKRDSTLKQFMVASL